MADRQARDLRAQHDLTKAFRLTVVPMVDGQDFGCISMA